jgi:alkylhydroperoxidase family enzyme
MRVMPWIQDVPDEEATGELRRLYDELRDPRGHVDHILTIHGLHPESLAVHAALYRLAMRPTPDLSRLDRETIAVVVSAVNGCHY